MPFFLFGFPLIDSACAWWKCNCCSNKSHEVFVWGCCCRSQHTSQGKKKKKQSQTMNTCSPFSQIALIGFLTLHFCFICYLQLDMQRGVHGRLMDNSTSVREAAVELLGRFVLCRPQLAEQYYDMLIERILVWLLWNFNILYMFFYIILNEEDRYEDALFSRLIYET